ncbi:MAG: sulfatase [Opitutaceae bacterium]|nr:sulfatase [Opitutaceae bacterium]
MKTTEFTTRLWLLMVVAPCLLAQGQNAPAVAPRPNFVFIIGDDISAEDFGCYGNAGIKTPHIDRLAAESLRFTNGYLTISSCSPSRCSFLTGRYPHNLETASELHGVLPPGVAMFPQLLRAAGYFSAQAGKTHFGDDWNAVTGPAVAAFDVGSASKEGAGPGGAGQWIERLRTRPAGRPFFMWFAAHDAHRPFGANKFAGANRPQDVRVPPYLIDTPETRRDLADYYDEITRFDDAVGEVVRELARQGVLDNTVIIVTSDNGRPFPHSKTQLYDDGIKMPLIIRWAPGGLKPRRTEALASAIDVAPTILELAGVPKAPTIQGVSLVPVLKDPRATVRDVVFAEHNWHNFAAHLRLVRMGRDVYLRNAWPDLPLDGTRDSPSANDLRLARAAGKLTPLQENIFIAPRPAEEFYDLAADPLQAHNIVGTVDPARLNRMRALLDRWASETGDSIPSVSERTPSDTDYVTGKKPGGFKRGQAPGVSTRAAQINRSGPVRN